jgi:hypothetical protein
MTDFSLFLDDSGHPDNQPYLVVAGYVATESQWLAFEPQWRSALARFKLGDVFHMTDFMHDSYSNLRRDQILSALALVAKRNTIHPFVCALDLAAYKRVNDEYALQECHGAPFAITARSLARAIHIWQKENLKEGDHFLTFIEEGTKHYGDLEQVFKRDGIPIPNRVPKAMPQVQPSDILAWETFHWLFSGTNKFGKNLDRLTRYVRFKEEMGGMIYERDLRRICADTIVPLRSNLTPTSTIAFHSERKRKRKRTIK